MSKQEMIEQEAWNSLSDADRDWFHNDINRFLSVKPDNVEFVKDDIRMSTMAMIVTDVEPDFAVLYYIDLHVVVMQKTEFRSDVLIAEMSYFPS